MPYANPITSTKLYPFFLSRRERHAKTIDIAQEEVLTCIGLYIYERFHRIYQAMKAEEQTLQILFYASIHTLKKSFEVSNECRQIQTSIKIDRGLILFYLRF